MKLLCCALCCLSLAALPLLAQPKASGKAPMTDQQFVAFAAQTDMVEANLGQLAQTRAQSPPVKDYAQMLVTDHTGDYQELKNAAQQANLTVPAAIDAEHNKAMIGPFHKLQGAAFDHKYAQEMVAGHTRAIEIYRKEAQDAQDPTIQSYAQTALAVLQKHLDGARNLEKGSAGKR